jgi:phage baseplate assembly protein W|tara:strand:- start:33123 stop:33572 length:450 start_codon:yes stop_codon:yes gene_type:complete
MSTLEKKLYSEITIRPNVKADYGVGTRTYRGFSTVNSEASSFVLYDIELIKQDIINNFHVRQGELLSNPEFGTIIWDIIFEPLTEQLKNAITENVTQIINSDPRVQVDSISIDQYDSGIQLDATLVYLPYNIAERMQLTFDENNGFTSQ